MDKKQYELNKGLAQMLKGGVIMDAVSYTHLFSVMISACGTPTYRKCHGS